MVHQISFGLELLNEGQEVGGRQDQEKEIHMYLDIQTSH